MAQPAHQQQPPPAPRPQYAHPLQIMNPNLPGAALGQHYGQLAQQQQPFPHAQQAPGQLGNPPQLNQTQPNPNANLAAGSQVPTRRDRMWKVLERIAIVVTPTALVVALLAFWPTSEGLNQGEKSFNTANWGSWLSFKQDCEARVQANLPRSDDCEKALNMTIPAPPHAYRIVREAVESFSRKSIALTGSAGGVYLQLLALGLLSIVVYELLPDPDPRLLDTFGRKSTAGKATIVSNAERKQSSSEDSAAQGTQHCSHEGKPNESATLRKL